MLWYLLPSCSRKRGKVFCFDTVIVNIHVLYHQGGILVKCFYFLRSVPAASALPLAFNQVCQRKWLILGHLHFLQSHWLKKHIFFAWFSTVEELPQGKHFLPALPLQKKEQYPSTEIEVFCASKFVYFFIGFCCGPIDMYQYQYIYCVSLLSTNMNIYIYQSYYCLKAICHKENSQF